jgi:hypothetical protein
MAVRKKGLSREELGFRIGERTVTISKISSLVNSKPSIFFLMLCMEYGFSSGIIVRGWPAKCSACL